MPAGKIEQINEDVIEELIKTMLDQGGIKTENIIEIQRIFDCIVKNSSIPKENSEKMIHSLEMLINMSNCYLNNFEKLKKLNSPVQSDSPEDSDSDYELPDEDPDINNSGRHN
mgnify:CR=1 FL=1